MNIHQSSDDTSIRQHQHTTKTRFNEWFTAWLCPQPPARFYSIMNDEECFFVNLCLLNDAILYGDGLIPAVKTLARRWIDVYDVMGVGQYPHLPKYWEIVRSAIKSLESKELCQVKNIKGRNFDNKYIQFDATICRIWLASHRRRS